MRIKLFFVRWAQKSGRSVPDEKAMELSLGAFHGGSTFPGAIHTDAHYEAELQRAAKAGYEPVFALNLADYDGKKEVKPSDYFKWVVEEEGDLPVVACIRCGTPCRKMTYQYDGSMGLEISEYGADSDRLDVTESDSENGRLLCGGCLAVIPEGAFGEDWNDDGFLEITIKLERGVCDEDKQKEISRSSRR